MTPEEFVEAIREFVQQAAVDTTVSLLEHPPGRRPRPDLVKASAWYHALNEQDRARIRSVAALAAHAAVFGFLAVIDGTRVVEDGPEKGTFTLTFHKGDQEWELNPGGMPLHELLDWPLEPGAW